MLASLPGAGRVGPTRPARSSTVTTTAPQPASRPRPRRLPHRLPFRQRRTRRRSRAVAVDGRVRAAASGRTEVTVVTVYRVASAEDPTPMFHLVDRLADGGLDAVPFTSGAGRGCADGPLARPAPRRACQRLPGRRARRLRRAGDRRGPPVVPRQRPPGDAALRPLGPSAPPAPLAEHAVEMAVARLRSTIGSRSVQAVVKRGYRLALPRRAPAGRDVRTSLAR